MQGDAGGILTVHLPVGRFHALTRAAIWLTPSIILGALTLFVYGGLSFRPSGISSRLVNVSIAVAACPLALGAIATAIRAFQWGLLALWPRAVGVTASATELRFELGPFGTRSYDAKSLDVRYPFELSGDAEGGGFEAFLPEDEQMATLLPRMIHPQGKEPLNRVILRYSAEPEATVSQRLLPVTRLWRAARKSEPRP